MKRWVQKFVTQIGDWDQKEVQERASKMSESKATVLYILDAMSSHLLDIDGHPVRSTRKKIDDLCQMLAEGSDENAEKILFKIRQFYSSYRIDEYAYIGKTFDDFKNVIWDFADQLGEETKQMQNADRQIEENLNLLREAVESNSIDELRSRSREFIDFYIEIHTRREEHRSNRMNSIQKNLLSVEKRLDEATKSAVEDHLSGALNRRGFDSVIHKVKADIIETQKPAALVICDIDFFKRINDVFGHDIGDHVIKECVRILKEVFYKEHFSVCRIGGEEFAVIMPNTPQELALHFCNEALERIRKEAIVFQDQKIQFTCSLGLAPSMPDETRDEWIKRADEALYESKNNGRDQLTLAFDMPKKPQVA